MKVTVTKSGALSPASDFFRTGDEIDKVVYCSGPATRRGKRLASVATVVTLGATLDMAEVSADLRSRGVRRLMVEGGSSTHTQFLTAGLADELQLVIAPLFVGDSRSRRFVGDGTFPWSSSCRATLAEMRPIGDAVLLRYALSRYYCADGARAT